MVGYEVNSQIADVEGCGVLQGIVYWLWFLFLLVTSVLMPAPALRIEVGARLVEPIDRIPYHHHG